MQRVLGGVFLCLLFMAGAAFTAEAASLVRVGGTGSALGGMQLLAQAFEKDHAGVKVEVLPSLGSAGGVRALANGAIDIALSGRPLKPQEQGDDLVVTEYVRSPLLFVAGSRVEKSEVSFDEIVAILGGQMQIWPNGQRIRPILRPEGDSDTEILCSASRRLSRAIAASLEGGGMALALTDQENADLLEKIPGSFGFLTLTQLLAEGRTLKVLSLSGVEPSLEALAAGTYPFYKSMFLVTCPDKLSEPARLFAAFVSSPQGRRILAASGNLVVE